jgi:hypothetical protein
MAVRTQRGGRKDTSVPNRADGASHACVLAISDRPGRECDVNVLCCWSRNIVGSTSIRYMSTTSECRSTVCCRYPRAGTAYTRNEPGHPTSWALAMEPLPRGQHDDQTPPSISAALPSRHPRWRAMSRSSASTPRWAPALPRRPPQRSLTLMGMTMGDDDEMALVVEPTAVSRRVVRTTGRWWRAGSARQRRLRRDHDGAALWPRR